MYLLLCSAHLNSSLLQISRDIIVSHKRVKECEKGVMFYLNIHLISGKYYNQDVHKCVKTMIKDDASTSKYMATFD
jgi:hypothetical protein